MLPKIKDAFTCAKQRVALNEQEIQLITLVCQEINAVDKKLDELNFINPNYLGLDNKPHQSNEVVKNIAKLKGQLEAYCKVLDLIYLA